MNVSDLLSGHFRWQSKRRIPFPVIELAIPRIDSLLLSVAHSSFPTRKTRYDLERTDVHEQAYISSHF